MPKRAYSSTAHQDQGLTGVAVMRKIVLNFSLVVIGVVSLSIVHIWHLHTAYGDAAAPSVTSSVHAGVFYPAGVDLIGYTSEHKTAHGFYWYSTFGFPSLAAVGVSLYLEHDGNGPVATAGVGIGAVAYTSLAYQIRAASGHYVKIGGGYVTSIVYTGLYPVLSYEMRY